MKIAASIIFLFCFSLSALANEQVKALWTSFYHAAKAEKFSEPVKIYAIDTAAKQMCFIYKKQVWFFRDGKIERSAHAKIFNVDGINRISYEQRKSGGFFALWSNEEIVLSLGS